VTKLDANISPEQARQVLSMLTDGGSMDAINTPLALRLIGLAQELGEEDLAQRLLDHALEAAADDSERMWTRFEGLKMANAGTSAFEQLAETVSEAEGVADLNAAVHHHLALMFLADDALTEARAMVQRSLAVRETNNDREGITYGLALLVAVAKRQHDMDTAIAAGTQRVELLGSMNKHTAKMEALADLAHAQATIGAFEVANELFSESLELATELEDLSGQLVARWGLADLAEIGEDYETAMLVLSDCLHAFMAENVPTPAAVRQRIQALTALRDGGAAGDGQGPHEL